MKKKTKASAVAKVNAMALLIEQVRTLVKSARQAAAGTVNTLQVLTNLEIGRLIVEHEQEGIERAVYGKETLKVLAASRTQEFGRGFSERNLEYFRKFYVIWKDRVPEISQKPSAKLPAPDIRQKASDELLSNSEKPSRKLPASPISEKASRKLPVANSRQTVSDELDRICQKASGKSAPISQTPSEKFPLDH